MKKINKHNLILFFTIISFISAAILLATSIYSAVMGYSDAIKKTVPKEEDIKVFEATVASIEQKQKRLTVKIEEYDCSLVIHESLSDLYNDIKSIESGEKIFFGYACGDYDEYITLNEIVNQYDVSLLGVWSLKTDEKIIFTYEDSILAKKRGYSSNIYYEIFMTCLFLVFGTILAVLCVESKKETVKREQ